MSSRQSSVAQPSSFSAQQDSSAGIDDDEKFVTSCQTLILGKPQEAALGLNPFMRVSDEHILRGMAQGVASIVREFDEHGTKEDK
eukprot:2234877-Prymnesium_polylepis.1